MVLIVIDARYKHKDYRALMFTAKCKTLAIYLYSVYREVTTDTRLVNKIPAVIETETEVSYLQKPAISWSLRDSSWTA